MDLFSYILGKQSTEGGGDKPTGTINVTSNGSYNVKSYATARVNVPNSYSVSDEGKVVSNGELVAQTSKNIVENGTVDTTANNQVIVAVPDVDTLTADELLKKSLKKYNATQNGLHGKLFVNGKNVAINGAFRQGSMNVQKNNLGDCFALNGKYTDFTAPLFDGVEANWNTAQTSQDGDCYQSHVRYTSGAQVYPLCCTPNDNKARTVYVGILGGYWTSSLTISNLQFNVDNTTLMTINEMVDNDIIRPLVIMQSGSDDSAGRGAFYENGQLFLHLLNNGSTYGRYPAGWMVFILNAGHYISDIHMTASSTAASYSGQSNDSLRLNWFDVDLFDVVFTPWQSLHEVSARNTDVPSTYEGINLFNDSYARTKADFVGVSTELVASDIGKSADAFFRSRHDLFRPTSLEYYGNTYGNTSMIEALGLVLLGDTSATSASSIELSDSLDNYCAVVLNGIYRNQPSSGYNTSMMYPLPEYNHAYWTGMKDRNTSYDCFVTFTDDTHATLTGNRQVIIYGIPVGESGGGGQYDNYEEEEF